MGGKRDFQQNENNRKKRDNFGLDLILSFFCSDLLKYEGAAKDVFNIAMDLQIILSTVFKEEPTDL